MSLCIELCSHWITSIIQHYGILIRGSIYACLIKTFLFAVGMFRYVPVNHILSLAVCVSCTSYMHFVLQDVQIDVCAILNDTTGTLMSCAWKNFNCKIGLIVGTWVAWKIELLFTWCTSTVCKCMHLCCEFKNLSSFPQYVKLCTVFPQGGGLFHYIHTINCLSGI